MVTIFDDYDQILLRKNRVKSFLISLLIMSCSMLLLYFITLKQHDPPLSESSGVIINIGIVDEGSGDIQPQSTNGGEVSPVTTPSNPSNSHDNMLTADNNDAPKVPPQSDNTSNKPPVINAPVIPKKVDPKFTVPKGQNNHSTSQGTTNKPGDQGKPDGDINGTDYNGNPGVGHIPGPGGAFDIGGSLTNRSIIKNPILPVNTCGVYGKVEIKITVDKNGNVVIAYPTGVGTTSSKCLKELAVASAKTCVFNKTNDPSIPEAQTGTITFNFTAK